MDINNYTQIPDHMLRDLQAYVRHHRPVGHFLQAVITNDLKEACGRADSTNVKIIPVYVAFLYNHAPANCWGSKELYQQWLQGEDAS